MDWTSIETEADLDSAIELSFKTKQGVAIFKHSTRCSISSVAKSRLSSSWDFNEDLPIYILDLISFRSLSSLIAAKFNVEHESPQLIIVKDGKSIYDTSHMSISVNSIHAALETK